MWQTRRETFVKVCRKDEMERLGQSKQMTLRFGEKLIEERKSVQRKMALQDSQIYLQRYNSRLSFEKNKKENEDKTFNESQKKLQFTIERVDENIKRRVENM